ncbi:MAG: hypothetical protein AAF668_15965 [Pseudomonadota bacterium]
MSNKLTIGLIVLVGCVYLSAAALFDEPLVFLGRKFLDLIAWVAFWR